MIYYNSMHEAWQDENDEDFCVGMSCEGELPASFISQDEFWNWYYENQKPCEIRKSVIEDFKFFINRKIK
jgi:hypothetical protein